MELNSGFKESESRLKEWIPRLKESGLKLKEFIPRIIKPEPGLKESELTLGESKA